MEPGEMQSALQSLHLRAEALEEQLRDAHAELESLMTTMETLMGELDAES
jgi:hypothetical protein